MTVVCLPRFKNSVDDGVWGECGGVSVGFPSSNADELMR